MRAMQAHQ